MAVIRCVIHRQTFETLRPGAMPRLPGNRRARPAGAAPPSAPGLGIRVRAGRLAARADRPLLAARRVGDGDAEGGQLVPEPVGGGEVPGRAGRPPRAASISRGAVGQRRRPRRGRPTSRARSSPSSRSTCANVSNFDPGGIAPSCSSSRSPRSAAGVSRSLSNAPVMSLDVLRAHRLARRRGPVSHPLPPAPQRHVSGLHGVPGQVHLLPVPVLQQAQAGGPADPARGR